jgi:mutual gliding-motility protein MglA
MVQFRPQAREIIAKIVYYGPPLGGKTTNLRALYAGYPPATRGELVVVPAGGDRTIFFDFLPVEAGTLRNMRLRVQLYTVPGQVHYNATRQVVLRGADAIVFVADSQKEMLRTNRESWENLKDNLLLQGIAISDVPHVLQYNKRDLGHISSVDELDRQLNEYNAPFFEAVATQGIGVEETLHSIVKLVARSLRERFHVEPETAPAPAIVKPPSAAPAKTMPPPPDPFRPVTEAPVTEAPAQLDLRDEPRVPVAPLVSAPVASAPVASSPVASSPVARPALLPDEPAIEGVEIFQPTPVTLPPSPEVMPQVPFAVATVDEFAEQANGMAQQFVTPRVPVPALEPFDVAPEVHAAAAIEDVFPPLPAPSKPRVPESQILVTLAAPELDEIPTLVGIKTPSPAPASIDEIPTETSIKFPPGGPGEAEEQAGEIPAQIAVKLPETGDKIVERITPRALAQLGDVRELELEVPVPAVWTGGRRLTLQLRLTLVPQEGNDAG